MAERAVADLAKAVPMVNTANEVTWGQFLPAACLWQMRIISSICTFLSCRASIHGRDLNVFRCALKRGSTCNDKLRRVGANLY